MLLKSKLGVECHSLNFKFTCFAISLWATFNNKELCQTGPLAHFWLPQLALLTKYLVRKYRPNRSYHMDPKYEDRYVKASWGVQYFTSLIRVYTVCILHTQEVFKWSYSNRMISICGAVHEIVEFNESMSIEGSTNLRICARSRQSLCLSHAHRMEVHETKHLTSIPVGYLSINNGSFKAGLCICYKDQIRVQWPAVQI